MHALQSDRPEATVQSHVRAAPTLRDLLGVWTVREYVQRIRCGLRQPRESGEHRFAMHQLARMWSPIAAVGLPLLLTLAVLLAPADDTWTPLDNLVTVLQPTEVPKLDLEPAPAIPPPDTFVEPEPLVVDPELVAAIASADRALPGHAGLDQGAAPFSGPASLPGELAPANLDGVSRVISAIRMDQIYVGRTTDGRVRALAAYGLTGAGAAATERAVYGALRWLKLHQESDGSWTTASGGGEHQFGGARPAMTGLALLTFLAHGETTASAEFGPTIERALKWLVANQDAAGGQFAGADEHNYSLPIAAYALCEAYAMTRTPMVKAAAERAIAVIARGQNAAGYLWNYNVESRGALPAAAAEPERNDLSYAAWCMQALKAADVARLEVDGLKATLQKSVQGIRLNGQAGADGARAFGYSRTRDVNGPWEITGAGVLCLQLLGAGKSKEAQDGLRWLERATCDWETPWQVNRSEKSANAIYHWYYVTQAKFHAGGRVWDDWDRQFSAQLVKHQIVERGAAQDAAGRPVDVGHWPPASATEYCQSPVYNTTLCALMLQVYYRNMLTYKPPVDIEPMATTLAGGDNDVTVEIL